MKQLWLLIGLLIGFVLPVSAVEALSEEDFDFIWDKIYLSYHTDSLSFATCIGDDCVMEDQSF